jgi:hypothetical protein
MSRIASWAGRWGVLRDMWSALQRGWLSAKGTLAQINLGDLVDHVTKPCMTLYLASGPAFVSGKISGRGAYEEEEKRLLHEWEVNWERKGELPHLQVVEPG